MNTPAPALLLDRHAVAAVLTMDDCIAAVEAAFLAFATGRSLDTDLSHVDAPTGEFHIKSGGVLQPAPYFACKINGSFFENRATLGLPNIIGLIVLSDAAMGKPLAVMESGLITRMRTGAATAVAAKYLAKANSSTVTICGAGLQGAIQLQALARVLPLQKAFIWSRNPERARELSEQAGKELKIETAVATDLAAATQASDVVVTCTPSKEWFVGRRHIAPGTLLAAVGADSPGKQEIEPALVAATTAVCDVIDQCIHVGELQHAYSQGSIKQQQLRSLGAVIAGSEPRRERDDQVILFDSTGTALQDAAAAALVYRLAQQRGLGQPFPFWG